MLKSLDLFGFKSFADRTSFDFAPGVTCVVGPNGSGKSNVVDALKWILGDQSAKSLRGKEMTDVIFNGAAGRKPAGYAEATLTFDNTEGHLTTEHQEVQIGRRLYRSGESEYLINKLPVRLKDVRDLFLGTGSSAYSIIEQGRVDALLQTTTQNRRAVFEEAAGISRFNQRKQDALRKLDRVGQNLLRLTDIVDEVRSQLDSVRSQAGKAAKFREYSEELRHLRIGLSADDLRSMTAELGEIEQKSQSISAKIAVLSEEHQIAEKNHADVDRKVAEVEDQLRAAERLAAQNREEIAGHEATITHQQARQTELESELERLTLQQQELASRSYQAVGELQETEGTLQQFASELETRGAELKARADQLAQLTAMIDDARETLEQDRARQLELLQLISVLGNRGSAFLSRFDSLKMTEHRILGRISQLDEDISAVRAELETRKVEIGSAAETLSGLRGEVQEAKRRREETLIQIEDIQRTITEQREERSAIDARRAVLEDLERRQEGLGIGVKEILARASSGISPWNTVMGSVAELLVVDLEDAALLEVSLGARSQTIIVSDLDPLVEYIQAGKCQLASRVGFVSSLPPLTVKGTGRDAILWQEENSSHTTFEQLGSGSRLDLSNQPGVRCRADQLVRSSSGIQGLAERLLGNTWIVESLQVAFQLAPTAGPNIRFVTMQGELLDQDGTLFVGMLRPESALVPRKTELRALKHDQLRLESRIEQEEQRLAEHQQAIAGLTAAQNEAERRVDEFGEHVAQLKSEVGSREMGLERLQREQNELRTELDGIQDQRASIETERSAALQELKDAQDELDSLKGRIDVSEIELTEHDSVRNEYQQEITREQLELAKQEERLYGLRTARERLDQECAQRDMHRDEAERRLTLIREKLVQIQQHLEQTGTQLKQLQSRREEFDREVTEIGQKRDNIRLNRSELAERELKLRHERRELKESIHEFELSSREIRQQIDHLVERIQDEYQIDLHLAAAEGESALHPRVPEEESELQPTEASDHSESNFSLPDEDTSVEEAEEELPEPDLALRRQEIEDRIEKLRRKLKQIGNVNTDSLQTLDELETRYQRLNGQLQDLVEAKTTLEEIVRKINQESKRLFVDSFTEIRKHFQELFRKLFGGGDGDVVLEDPEDVLECGIEIVARPPGKELRSISLLSGGEKTLTAVALLMAIFRSKPSPFCILDEVDAALDEGNIERYMRVVQEFRETTQFIIISHSKRTMSVADVLYGVTMEESGVSKRMSVRFEDVGDDGKFTSPSDGAAA